jgi:hypothetical protein
MVLTGVALAGCSRGNAQETTVQREPVASFPGGTPFTPSVGSDRSDVTPPPGAGGSFPGDTVGLFGGTEDEATCDKAQLVAFLQQDRAKAEAWAGVVGISVDDIPAFVASLTPVLLRTDTQVINHGFRDGKAVEIPAVLQAGTAVLVDVHGAPVTKCFCGNPLKPPKQTTSVKFVGPQWPSFSPDRITVVVPVTQTVQQFVLVEPDSGKSFQRPAGTAGRQDAPAPSPAPSTLVPPSSPPPPPPTSGTITPGSPPPPPGVVPTATPTISPSPPASPSGMTTSPSPTTSPTRSPSPTASPTTSPPTSPTASPPTSPTTSPAPTGSPTGTPSPTATSPTSPTPTGSQEIVRASWAVGNCFVQAGRAHATVLVRQEGTMPHTFTLRVALGDRNAPVAVETIQITAAPREVAQAEIDVPTNTPDGRVQCAILSIVDENNVAPVAGEPLPPPSDTVPMPAQPSPGQTTGPLPSPPTPVVPTQT